jgi:hypothetical protein
MMNADLLERFEEIPSIRSSGSCPSHIPIALLHSIPFLAQIYGIQRIEGWDNQSDGMCPHKSLRMYHVVTWTLQRALTFQDTIARLSQKLST